MTTARCHRTIVLAMLGAALSLTACERDSAVRERKAPAVVRSIETPSPKTPSGEARSAEMPLAETPRIVDHPLLHLGRNGHLAGSPVAVAGVRCFRQVPRSGPDGDAWFYCIADVDMNIDEPSMLPPERADIRIASATVTVHPVETEHHGTEAEPEIWTVRRVDVAGATVKVLGTEFRGRPGYRIGYAMSADGRGGMYGRTVLELRDPTTKDYIGAFCVIVTRFP